MWDGPRSSLTPGCPDVPNVNCFKEASEEFCFLRAGSDWVVALILKSTYSRTQLGVGLYVVEECLGAFFNPPHQSSFEGPTASRLGTDRPVSLSEVLEIPSVATDPEVLAPSLTLSGLCLCYSTEPPGEFVVSADPP
ncbi:unnamed protein product [Echinostoma caproni]|uniref:Cystatin domain-containing protein n=1 Tax=Echinostoma caproni TaxID=27848 RepID=A0A183B1M3_9TREM|nr:unnamed protein product [Echinostoma caproni]